MNVNGKPRWTCRTHVSVVAHEGQITIEPSAGMPRIKDLVVSMTEFFDKWKKAGTTFVGTATRHDPPAAISPDSKKRKMANAAIECINCGVCVTPRATWLLGTKTTSALRPSTVLGRCTTTNATPIQSKCCNKPMLTTAHMCVTAKAAA